MELVASTDICRLTDVRAFYFSSIPPRLFAISTIIFSSDMVMKLLDCQGGGDGKC